MLLRMTPTALLGPFLMTGVLLGVTAAPVRAQTTLYDDFNAPQINPDNWLGVQPQFGAQGGLELVRDIDFDPTSLQGSLLMSHRVAGGTSTNAGQRDSRNRLLFLNPAAITAVKFDVAVTQFSLLGCSEPGSAPTLVFPQFLGFLFNDGSSTGPQDTTGDIGASVGLSRRSDSADPPGVLRAFGTLFRCTGPSQCLSFESTFVNLGPVGTGETVTLRMSWDQAGKRVDFQKNADAVQSIPYTQDDSRPPSLAFKALEVVGRAANCTVAPRPVAEVTASFDNVFVTNVVAQGLSDPSVWSPFAGGSAPTITIANPTRIELALPAIGDDSNFSIAAFGSSQFFANQEVRVAF